MLNLNQIFKIPFPILFNLALIFPILYFAGLNSAIAYLLIFFLPGYFLLGLFLNSQFYRTIFAAPISLVAISIPSYALGLFFLKTINLLFALTIVVICFIIFYFLKNSPKFSPKEPSKLIHLVAILLAAFAFVELTIHAGGTYSSPFPRIVSLDNSRQVAQLDWQVEREIPTLSPWLHYGKEIFTAYSPPLSIVVPAFVAKLSGLSTFDAQNLTQSLIFAFTVAMCLTLITFVFDNRIAISSALFLAIPAPEFLISNFSGMTRIPLGIFFILSSLIFFFFLLRNYKHSGILIGLSVAGLFLSHPSDSLVLLIPFIVFLYLIFNSRNKSFYKKEFLNFAVISSLGIIFFWYLFPFLSIYSAKKLQPFSIMSFEQFEQLASNVGPMFKLSEFWLYAVIFALSAIFFFFIIRKKFVDFFSKPQLIFCLTAFVIFLLSLGIFVFSYEYQAKLRYVFYAIFLMPTIFFVFQNFATYLPWQKSHAIVFIILLILSPSILTNLPKNFKESAYFGSVIRSGYTINQVKTYKEAWDAITWLKDNTPKDSSILAALIFNQNTGALTHRKTALINEHEYPDFVKGGIFQKEKNLICIDGFSFSQFPFSYEPCDQTAKITDYDYVVGQFLDPHHVPGVDTKILKAQLLSKGYNKVYENENLIIIFEKPK